MSAVWLTIKVEKGSEGVIGVFSKEEVAIAFGKKLVGELCIPEFMIQEWELDVCSTEFDDMLAMRIKKNAQ